MKKKFYITTAIPYASEKPHIGNTYEVVLADAIARYKKLLGYDVYFQTGTDEHGQKNQLKARAKGKSTSEHVDEVTAEIKRIWDIMNTSYDAFVRTTDPLHKETVQKIFKRLYEQGDIYKGVYEGLYCTPCESFFTETQLVDGKCPDCGREVQKTSEEAYFLKLDKYVDKLLKYIEENPKFLWPESRKNEMMNNFIKPGLQDLCVTRSSFDWGVKVDFDPKHIIYVWIDALSNYITFLGYDVDGNHDEKYKKYWPANIHLIGKDIFRFHSIYWPIMLLALGEELPKQIFGHPWFLMEEGKMSKSKGNVMYADDLVSFFGVDAVRYYILNEMPYVSDGIISYDLIIERINSDLVNSLGNLIHRTISMSYKYFDGIIKANNCLEKIDEELIELALSLPQKVDEAIDDVNIGKALEHIFTLVRRCNKYIEETAPWELAKDPQKEERLGSVLYNLLECIRFIAILLQPFIPDTTDKIFWQLDTNNRSIESLAKFGGLPVGHLVKKTEPLFLRIDKEKKLKEIEEYFSK